MILMNSHERADTDTATVILAGMDLALGFQLLYICEPALQPLECGSVGHWDVQI